MKKLFLSGGGGAKESELLDKRFADSLPNKKFLYIPIAMEGSKKHPYDQCLQWIKKTFSPLMKSDTNITMLTNLDSIGIDYLKTFDAVYMGGGNTYKLLRRIKNSNFDSVLRTYVGKYGHIYGGSAGAIVMGKNIETVKEENTISYNQSDGINLLKDLSVICHFKNTPKEKRRIYKFINRHNSGVFALPEETGLIITGSEIEVVGRKPAYVFYKGSFPFSKVKGELIYEKIA